MIQGAKTAIFTTNLLRICQFWQKNGNFYDKPFLSEKTDQKTPKKRGKYKEQATPIKIRNIP